MRHGAGAAGCEHLPNQETRVPGADVPSPAPGAPVARRCVRASLKNNLATPQPTLGYHLVAGAGALLIPEPNAQWLRAFGWKPPGE